MESPFTLSEIVAHTQASLGRFRSAALQWEEERFFHAAAPDRWSAAQHVDHLATALKTSTAAYALPAWLVRWVGGTPTQGSCTYPQLVARYQQSLQQGGKASGRYIPGNLTTDTGQAKVMARFERAAAAYLKALAQTSPEEKLDAYQVSHPLLKKITLRELAFFNSYHILHHLPGVDGLAGRH